MHRLRQAALFAAVALAGSLLGASAVASPRTSSVVLVLRPMSDSALQSLVVAHGVSRAERARRVQALVPDAARHRAVVHAVAALGLHVQRASTWSLRVSGPSVSVTAMFGSLAPHRTASAGRAFPALPSTLSPYVVAALPASGRVAHPLTTASPRDGNDFRAAYSAPPGSTGAGLAVATVQLSGWRAQDLDAYAKRHNIAFDFSKQYVAVSEAGASTDTPDSMGGDEEVALDQEAILATAPGATQVAYFAPNTDGGDGYINAIRQVGSDANARHIATLSLSWGGCEASDDRPWLAAMDSALKFALASGVTIFAASGDQGSQDCIGEIPGSAAYAPSVDFPASSPYVVAVGGASLPAAGSSSPPVGWSGSGGGESIYEALPSWQYGVASHGPNNNHRLLPDLASDADPTNGFCVYMKTGGEAADARCTGADAGSFMLAGTSLASPTQAALLADTLSAGGWTGGVGDIHQALYQSASSGALTDVTSDEKPSIGNGTYYSGPGFDMVTGLGTPVWTSLQSWLGEFEMGAPRGTRSTSFSIAPQPPAGYVAGYQSWSAPVLSSDGTADCSATSSAAPTSVALPAGSPDGIYTFSVAGMANSAASGGSPSCRVARTSVVLDRRAPRTGISVAISGSGVATAKWWFGDDAPSSGLQRFVVTATSGNAVQWSVTTTARSRSFNVLPHSRWHLRLTAYDFAGNAAVATAHVYDDGTAFSFSKGWRRVSAALAYRHSYALAGRPGMTARVTATARTFVLYVTRCPACGKLAVYDAHGRHVVTIDTYSSRTRYHVPVTLQSLAHAAKRTFVLKVLSSKNARSRGHDIGVDAFTFA